MVSGIYTLMMDNAPPDSSLVYVSPELETKMNDPDNAPPRVMIMEFNQIVGGTFYPLTAVEICEDANKLPQ